MADHHWLVNNLFSKNLASNYFLDILTSHNSILKLKKKTQEIPPFPINNGNVDYKPKQKNNTEEYSWS